MTEDDVFRLEYCLAKQLPTLTLLHSNYGTFELDHELAEAVRNILRPMLIKRLEGNKT